LFIEISNAVQKIFSGDPAYVGSPVNVHIHSPVPEKGALLLNFLHVQKKAY